MEEWNRLLALVPRVPLTQTFEYGVAIARTERFLPRLGIISADNRPIGIVQVLERHPLGVLHFARIHRGPLWLGSEPSLNLQRLVFIALRNEYPRGLTRWTTLLPELPAGDENAAMIVASGFRRTGTGYQTIWLDLSRPLEELRARLSNSWRNHLSLAERGPLVVDISTEGLELPWLANLTTLDQKGRHYRGPSGPLVIRLRNVFHRQGGVLLLRAMAPPGSFGEPEPVAGILVLRHQLTATWLIGWSGPTGRRFQAHTLLLWQTIVRLKALGTRWFDLGGINPTHAPGVTCFKRGLGGEEVDLVGSFR